MLLALALLCVLAAADSPLGPNEAEIRAWEELNDGRLDESLDGARSSAIEAYLRALDLLQDEAHPLRPEVLYWLARARYNEGDIAGARDALGRISDQGDMPARERALLAAVLAAERQVRRLPFRQDFHDDALPWVRSWARSSPDKDFPVIERAGGLKAMNWETLVRLGEDDYIFIPFRVGGPGPRVFSMRLTAAGFLARVRFVLEDIENQQWSSRLFDVPVGVWVDINLNLDEFALVGDPRSGRRVDPSRIRSLKLIDSTGFGQSDSGLHLILIDWLEIR